VMAGALALAGCGKGTTDTTAPATDTAAADATTGGAAAEVEWTLEVRGAVAKPLKLSFDELTAMPATTLTDIVMEQTRAEDTTNSWVGVSLAALLEQAGVEGDHGAVTATSSDGYAVVISPDELRDAIVAWKQDGAWIHQADAKHGPIRLVCPDIPANRWVFQLVSLELASPEEPRPPVGG